MATPPPMPAPTAALSGEGAVRGGKLFGHLAGSASAPPASVSSSDQGTRWRGDSEANEMQFGLEVVGVSYVIGELLHMPVH